MILDIDGFKQFNDSFGHYFGDSLLREQMRKSDISCLFGGDKFVLVLPDSSIADTKQRVELIRVLLEELQDNHYDVEQSLDSITLSTGIALLPVRGITESELLRAADEAKYTAKQGDVSALLFTRKRSHFNLPQVAEANPPQSMDVARE